VNKESALRKSYGSNTMQGQSRQIRTTHRGGGSLGLNGILFVTILLFGPGSSNSLAQEYHQPSGIYNPPEKTDQKMGRVLSEIEAKEGKKAVKIIECLHLLEKLEFFQQDSEKIEVFDLLILSSQ